MKLKKIIIQKETKITFSSPELLFLAKSGQPYRGTLHVQFQSVGESFDLLDFKKYITSLRTQTFYAEDIAHEIFSTIEQSIESNNLGVVIDLTARGGIQQRLLFGFEFEPTLKNRFFQV